MQQQNTRQVKPAPCAVKAQLYSIWKVQYLILYISYTWQCYHIGKVSAYIHMYYQAFKGPSSVQKRNEPSHHHISDWRWRGVDLWNTYLKCSSLQNWKLLKALNLICPNTIGQNLKRTTAPAKIRRTLKLITALWRIKGNPKKMMVIMKITLITITS